MTVRKAWQRHISELLELALERNDTAIDDIAAAIAAAILTGRHIYAFGAGHSLALVNEMYRRAGGLKVVRPIWNDALLSRSDEQAMGKLENEVGYYRELTGGLDWGPGDLCWVPHSVAIPGLAEWVAPTVAERLVAQGHVPEIWGSANRG